LPAEQAFGKNAFGKNAFGKNAFGKYTFGKNTFGCLGLRELALCHDYYDCRLSLT
jgi:hypothetical protein